MVGQGNLTRAVLLVLGSALVMLTVYEIIKQWLFPDITAWQSHTVTILLGGVLAATAAWWGLPRYHGLAQRLQQEKEGKDRLEAALRDERALLNALMENIPDSIYFKDAESPKSAAVLRPLHFRVFFIVSYHSMKHLIAGTSIIDL